METVLIVPPIPSELRKTLGESFVLADYVPGKCYPGFSVAVTTGIGGASRAFMEAVPDLRLLASNGVGLDRIDLEEARRRGIVVRHTPDEVTEDVAEFAIGLVYAVLRRIPEADRFVRSGAWERNRLSPSRRIAGLDLGIVGLGRIGRRIASRAEALGMTVSYTDRQAQAGVHFTWVPHLRALAQQVDVLVLSCPGGAGTRHLVDRAVLRALGPRGVLINVSRGEVVNEADLIAALEADEIAGAGIDVFEQEPVSDSRLCRLENVVLSPHYAAVTRETRQAMAEALRTAIADFLAGRPVANAAALPGSG